MKLFKVHLPSLLVFFFITSAFVVVEKTHPSKLNLKPYSSVIQIGVADCRYARITALRILQGSTTINLIWNSAISAFEYTGSSTLTGQWTIEMFVEPLTGNSTYAFTSSDYNINRNWCQSESGSGTSGDWYIATDVEQDYSGGTYGKIHLFWPTSNCNGE